MKKYTKKNGYYKYYNKDGLCCKVKFSKEALYNKSGKYIIKFKRPNDENFLWTMPKKFKNSIEVLNHIIENLETDKTIFKVEAVK